MHGGLIAPEWPEKGPPLARCWLKFTFDAEVTATSWNQLDSLSTTFPQSLGHIPLSQDNFKLRLNTDAESFPCVCTLSSFAYTFNGLLRLYCSFLKVKLYSMKVNTGSKFKENYCRPKIS